MNDGIVDLFDLPQKQVYLELDLVYKEKIRTAYKASRHSIAALQDRRLFFRWLGGEVPSIRLDVFRAILLAYGLPLSYQHILRIRGKGSGAISQPKLPFDFRTESGARFVAAILGDGSMDKHAISYANSEPALVSGFLYDAQNIFGDVSFSMRKQNRKSKPISVLRLPSICCKIANTLGLPSGSKVENNPSIPSCFVASSDKMIFAFLGRLIDDEGSVSIASRHIRIKLATIHSISNLLTDLKSMLLRVGIESSTYKLDAYPSSRGPSRTNWSIEIHGHENLKKILTFSYLRHPAKRKALFQVVTSIKTHHYLKRNAKNICMALMRRLELENGSFTALDLAAAANRGVGHCRNALNHFRKMNMISQISPAMQQGSKREFAKYVVCNETNSRFPSSLKIFSGN